MRLLRSIIFVCVAAAIVATQLGNGCLSTPTDTTTTTSSRDSDLSGPNSIPRDARIVDEGTARIAFTPQRGDGRVYLYDADDRVLLDSRNVRRGQEYAALIDQNKAQLGGKTVLERDLKRKHVHRIYYLPDDYRDRNWNRDGGGEPLVPLGAQLVGEGKGDLTYRTRANGRVYVVDRDDDRVVYTQDLQKTQTLVVTPNKDRITINNKAVSTGNLVRDHVHRVYFEKD